MLVATSRLWIERARQPDSALDFAVLESFLVHARNLHEFLRPRKDKEKDRRPGDYFASDFVDGFETEVYDEATIQNINRWLQHLTTWRYEDDEHPEWSLPKLLTPVVEGMGAFVGVLETESDKASALMDCHLARQGEPPILNRVCQGVGGLGGQDWDGPMRGASGWW